MNLDTDALVEHATQGRPLDFKDALTASMNEELDTARTNLDTAVQNNIMSGGDVENYAEVVGIVEDEPSGDEGDNTPEPEDKIAPISFF